MRKIYFLIVFLILITSMLFSCSDKKNDEKESETGMSQSQEDPSQKLMDLEENIQKVFIELAKPEPAVKEEGKKQEDGSQDSTEDGEEEKNSDEEDSEEKQSSKEDEQQDEKDKEEGEDKKEEEPDVFMTLSTTVDEIHTEWNEFIPELSKKNNDENLTQDFSAALNDMTNTILAKDKKGSLYATNYLYSFIPKFYNLYPGNEKHTLVKDMKYYVRNVLLYSVQDNNWDKALENIYNLMVQWDSLKRVINSEQSSKESSEKTSKEDEDITIQIEYSFTELKNAVDENNANIAEIKANIALTLLDDFEKKLKEQKESKEE